MLQDKSESAEEKKSGNEVEKNQPGKSPVAIDEKPPTVGLYNSVNHLCSEKVVDLISDN